MSEHEKSFAFGDWTLNDILHDQRAELKNALFRIPDYQRGYAWQERQWEEFWNDLVETRDRHYTGAITVEKVKEANVLEVVDGQQRLTTIALLFSVLCDDPRGNPLLAPSAENEPRFSYGSENENREYLDLLLSLPAFRRHEENGSVTYPPPQDFPAPANVSQRNLVGAKAFFSEKVSCGELENRGLDAPSLASRLRNNLFFDFRIITDEDEAGVVFETMNNRGKPLTLLEKLKNRLMYLSEFVGDDEGSGDDDNPVGAATLRERINSAWGEIYRVLASDPNRDPLDEDEFVAAHLSVYRNPAESVYSENVASSRLFKMFCEHPERHPVSEEIDERRADAVARAEKEPPLSFGKIGDYVEDLRTFASAWAAVNRELGSACGQCRLLSDRRETKIFLAAVFLHVQDEGLRENIYESARQILFRNTIGAGMDRSRFATLARRLHGVCVDQLKRGPRTPLDGPGILTELRNVLDNERKKPTMQTLVEFFADKQEGDFYGWSELGMRYFLMRHEADYPGRADGTARLTWEMFDDISVEHILPQSAATRDSRGWRWWNRVVLDWNDQTGPDNPTEAQLQDAAETLSGTLGNLVLLTREENSKVSSRAWETYANANRPGKMDFYLNPDHRSSNGAVALATGTKFWNAWHIRERGRELFRKLAADFGVTDRLSDSEVDRALGLDISDPNKATSLSDRSIRRLSDEEIASNVQRDEEEERAGFRRPMTEDDVRTYLQRQEVNARGQLKELTFAKGRSGSFNLNLLRRPDGAIRFSVYAYADKQKWQNQLKTRSDWPLDPVFPENRNSPYGIVAEFAIADQNWHSGQTDPQALLALGDSILDKLEREGFFA